MLNIWDPVLKMSELHTSVAIVSKLHIITFLELFIWDIFAVMIVSQFRSGSRLHTQLMQLS